MNRKHHPAITWMSVAALALLSSACGSSDSRSPSTGQALTDSSSASVVTLQDSSSPSRARAASVQADGSFTLDMADLTAPYLLRVEWTDAGAVRRFYGVSEGRENLDVNALTDVAFRGAHDAADDSGDDAEDDRVFEHSDGEGKRGAATQARLLLASLKVVLAPLFERYGITDPRTDRDAVRLLLRDVKVTKERRTVVVTNRATGAVIFTGQLSRLSEGTFTAASMPDGPGGPPAGTCTAFTYSDFGACQPDGTQTRTVLTSTPAGCTGGSPVLTQACTYVPPANACTSFTYSAFGACQPDGTQTRTVLTASPAGCSGGSPVLSQACTYVPPTDGTALYTQHCAGCHGNGKKGSSASAIQAAIDGNVGGMGSAALRALTPAQVAAIAAAP